jgi:hypothetical protein
LVIHVLPFKVGWVSFWGVREERHIRPRAILPRVCREKGRPEARGRS